MAAISAQGTYSSESPAQHDIIVFKGFGMFGTESHGISAFGYYFQDFNTSGGIVSLLVLNGMNYGIYNHLC